MEYYNEQDIPNHKVIKIKNLNNYKNKGYKYSSTDNIFQTEKMINLHKIYNKFLVNPYLIRKKRYQNALNDFNQKNNNYYLYNYNNYNKTFEDKNEELKNKPFALNTPLSYELEHKSTYEDNHTNNINFPNISDKNKKSLTQNDNIVLIPKIKEEKLDLDYKNRNKEIYKTNLNKNKFYNGINDVKGEDNNIFPKIIQDNKRYNTIERPIEYNINYNNNSNDIYFTNNNNKLSLSYDINKKRNMRNYITGKQYISPIITKIAKHNYLMGNPYSDKDENLGPSMLENNPILYPVSTYKFDFNRFTKGYYINKLN